MVELLLTQPSVVTPVTRLQTGQLRNCGSICDRGEVVFSCSKHLVCLWAPPSRLFSGYQELSPHKVKWQVHKSDHSPVSGTKVKNEWW